MSTNSKPYAYLAGKMSGLSYQRSIAWRKQLAEMLEPAFTVLSPMRGQAKIGFEDACAGACNSGFELTRDITDIERSDVIVARFGLNEPVSFGTGVELGTCIPLRKPVVFVFEPGDNLLQHPFVKSFPRGILTYSLEEASDYLYSMFDI